MRTGWIEVAAIPTLLLCAYLTRSNHWVSTHARRAWNWLRGWAHLAPFTTGLWLLVAVHAWMLVGLPPRVRATVLKVHSTNLDGLRKDPVTVLFSSAMWTDVGELVFLTGMSLVILGPLERWIGTRRAVAAFLTGHVGATLIVAMWLDQAVTSTTPGAAQLSRTIDVGVSYGTYCCAALLAYRLRMPYRLTAWILFGGWLVSQAADSDFDVTIDFTAIGHLMAFGLGLALYPLTLGAAARRRRSNPWIRILPVDPDRTPVPSYAPDAEVLLGTAAKKTEPDGSRNGV